MCGTDRAFRAAAQRFRKIQIPLSGSLADWLQQKRNPPDDFQAACRLLSLSGVCGACNQWWSVYIPVASLIFIRGSGGTGNLFSDFFGIVFRNLSGVFYHYLYWILPECGRTGIGGK